MVSGPSHLDFVIFLCPFLHPFFHIHIFTSYSFILDLLFKKKRVSSAIFAIFSSPDLMYLGCYNRVCFQNVTRSTVIDIDDCTSGCRNDSYQSAALSHGDTCYCGRFTCNTNDTECDNKCGVLCSGVQTSMGLKTCGGIGFIQVYTHGKIFIIFLYFAKYTIYTIYVVATQF